MRLIVDADPLVYRCGFAAEGEPLHHALNLVKQQLIKYKNKFGSEDMSVHLSGSQSNLLRKEMYDSYKAKRADKPKPEHYDGIREYLEKYWNAKIASALEADDEVALEATGCKEYSLLRWDEEKAELDQLSPSCVIISIDKDLDQVPGWHYKDGTTTKPKDWFYYVDRDTAATWWACQMLMGDYGDDIEGIVGVGPAKTKDLLLDICHWADMDDYEVFTAGCYADYCMHESEWLKTKNLITMVQDDITYEQLLHCYDQAVNSKPSVAR